MKELFPALVIVLLGTSLILAQSAAPKKVITAISADKSPALRDIVKTLSRAKLSGGQRLIPMRPSPLKERYMDTDILGPDPAWQARQGIFKTAKPIQNFEGLSDADNENVFGFRLVPPDPNGDVGPNHYVQMIKKVSAIYDKAGNTMLGPFPANAVWDGFGGLCGLAQGGNVHTGEDPIVLYDPLADRWLLTQLTLTVAPAGFAQRSAWCVACSETSDPTGAYFRYEFQFDRFPDYPKVGVWPDAYYATFNLYRRGTIETILAAALERDKILVGDPTARIVTSLSEVRVRMGVWSLLIWMVLHHQLAHLAYFWELNISPHPKTDSCCLNSV